VTAGDAMRILHRGNVVGELPVDVLVDDCPLYDLAPAPPDGELYPAPAPVLSGQESPAQTLLALLGSPNIASRKPVFEQYDPVVQSRTVRRPEEADAAVLALADGSAIAVSIDGNGRRVACDPRAGAVEAVYECVANLACVGAAPLGLTNCLNFGNPEKPHVAWQLSEAVEGVALACEALGLPVVGGNVSLYNEAPGGPILPTPVVGVVGQLPDAARAGQLGFAAEGDAIALVGPFAPSLNGSELAKLRGQAPAGPLPLMDKQAVRDAHEAVRDGVRSGALHNAHDIAEGGFGVALAECCIAGGIGARVELPDGLDLFGEAPGRGFIVSGPESALAGFDVIGRVGGESLEIAGILNLPVANIAQARADGLKPFL
jgi:phosphoribosylformylglycinamidine (FGAM) synthase-like enzyme